MHAIWMCKDLTCISTGLSEDEGEARGYVLENNPQLDVFDLGNGNKLPLQLAVNTAQYGRTFEDRYAKSLSTLKNK